MGVGVIVVVLRIVAAPFTPVSPKAGFDSIDGSVLSQSVGRTVEGSLSYSSYHSSCSVESRQASGLPAVGRKDGRKTKGRWVYDSLRFRNRRKEREGRCRRTLARSPSLCLPLSPPRPTDHRGAYAAPASPRRKERVTCTPSLDGGRSDRTAAFLPRTPCRLSKGRSAQRQRSSLGISNLYSLHGKLQIKIGYNKAFSVQLSIPTKVSTIGVDEAEGGLEDSYKGWS